MKRLVEITPDLFPRLYTTFLHDDDPFSDEEDWRRVFHYNWQRPEEHTGYALLDGDDVVGMMAMAFKERPVDGRPHRFCNLHTWWVHPDHRGHSAAMLRPLLGLRDHTVTHLTPCDRVRGLLARLGFEPLDQQMKVLLPLSPARAPGVRIDFGDAIERDALSPLEREILRDHEPYHVDFAHLRTNAGDCLVVYTCVERYRVRYCHIHHFSDAEVFAAHEEALRAAILRRHPVRLVMVDARLVRGMEFSRSFDFWAPAHGCVRTAGAVTPDRVDNLYTDVVMLRLAVMPHITHEVEKIVRRHFKLGEVPA